MKISSNLVPALLLDGNANEAIKFYEEVFSAKAFVTRFKDWPDMFDGDVPKELENLVAHAEIETENFSLYFSDHFDTERPYQVGSNISFCLNLESTEEAKSYFIKLSMGGKILTPFGETPFSSGYSQFIDQFGIEWQVQVDKEDEA